MNKKTLVIIIIVVLMSVSLCGCDDIPEEPGILPLSLQIRIEQDYAKSIGVEVEDVSVDAYYGMYGDGYAVYMVGDETPYKCLHDVDVAGVDFHYTSMKEIVFYKDGEFYSLREAYDGALLDREALAKIREKHKACCIVRYTEYENLLPSDLRTQIAESYARFVRILPESVSVSANYGEYDGTYALYMNAKIDYYQALLDRNIAGVVFRYNSYHEIVVYKDGAFYSLSEAYDNGWLSVSDLESIRNKHRNDFPVRYELNGE